MAPLPILIRILLCASLLLNGIGSATASARMGAMELRMGADAAHAAAIEHAAGSAADDCDHDKPGSASPDASLPSSAAPGADTAHDDDDCVRICLELCMHHYQAVFGLHACVAEPGIAAEPLRPGLPGPRSPSSPPPTRPPIA